MSLFSNGVAFSLHEDLDMFKKLIVVATLTAACVSVAHSADIKAYGVLDYSIGYFSTKIDGAESESGLQLDSGRWRGSRVGLKGQEDIGNGMKVSFVLENGFDADTGKLAQGQRMFGREAQLSLHTNYGTVAFGRMDSLSGLGSYGLTAGLSPFIAALGYAGQNNFLFGTARYDNMITYRTPTFSGFTVTLQHSLQTDGIEKAGIQNNNRYYGVGVRWKNPTTVAALIGEHYRFSDNSVKPQDDAWAVLMYANHKIGNARIHGHLQYMENAHKVGMPDVVNGSASLIKSRYSVTDDQGMTGYSMSLGLAYGIGGGTAKFGLSYLDLEDKGETVKTTHTRTIGAIGYLYPLSKRTSIFAQANYGQLHNKGGQQDATYTQAFVGIDHNF